MAATEDYLRRSRLFQQLKRGPHRPVVDLYAARLLADELAPHGVWRSLNLFSDLVNWLASRESRLEDLDENAVERFLSDRSIVQTIQPGDRAALHRLLSTLRQASVIAPGPVAAVTVHEQIFEAFSIYLRRDRGLVANSALRHLPVIRLFLREVCPDGPGDLSRIGRSDVVRFIERHAADWSPAWGKAMCWTLRSFLRYLHHKGLNPQALATCVPSIRTWRFVNLPTYLSAAQVQAVLEGCDRTTPLGRRDYAILLMLAKLGLRASEVATLTLDDIDWRAGEMRIRAKGRQQATMPIPPDVGAAIVAYLRDGRPSPSSCRRVFLRTLAPHTGFASGCAVTMIAKTALDRAGIHGCAHRGAHIFRHSLATELLRSGATLSQIGQLLRHQSHDVTRIYAKVDLAALRPLSLPWPGGMQ